MPGGSGVKGGGYTEGARVYNSANQSIPDATYSVVAHDSESYDTDNIHDPVTNNSRLTCRTAGKYLIGAEIRWLANATGRRMVILRQNATNIVNMSMGVPSAETFTQCLSTVWDLAVDDYLELTVYQNSGAPLDLQCSDCYTHFWMHRIG